MPGRLPGTAERNRVIRAAIAEAQRQHPTWTRAHLEWELYRQMPVLPAAADWCAYLAQDSYSYGQGQSSAGASIGFGTWWSQVRHTGGADRPCS